jgi:hypothetical protein
VYFWNAAFLREGKFHFVKEELVGGKGTYPHVATIIIASSA